MTSDEYPYLYQLSVPDRLRIAAHEARGHGVAAIHLMTILDAAEGLENIRTRNGQDSLVYLKTSEPSRVP